jgi:hypothetical protein
MHARHIAIGTAALVVGCVAAVAQTPVLGNIETPYPALQGSAHVAGQVYGSGAVTYGPVGTPLVLSGSDLGATGTVEFIAYKNGAVDTNDQTVVATPTM